MKQRVDGGGHWMKIGHIIAQMTPFFD